MKKTLGILAITCCLASCGMIRNFVPYVYGELNTRFDSLSGQGYHSIDRLDDFTHVGEDISSTYSKMVNDGTRFCLPSVGETNLLVIPVDFADSVGDTRAIPRIEQAFFGDMGSRYFPSVAEYYDKSSYGRLHIKGDVANGFYRSPYTAEELSNITGALQTKRTLQELYKGALSWYDKAFPNNPSSMFACTNHRGQTFVPVYFVYNAPYRGMDNGNSNRNSMLWAFTINDPAPVSWTSYHMISSGDVIDTHTCIHETGHLLGLPDYYDAEGDGNAISPLGRADMMDCSLGDHNPFSKFALGWIHPMKIEGTGKVKLRPFSDTGDALLLTSSFNGMLYDEYLMLCYYTPGSLNYFDAILREDKTMKMPNAAGILAYKIDARLGVFPRGIGSPSGFLTPSTDLTGRTVNFYCDNSGGKIVGEEVQGDYLVELLDASKGKEALSPYFVAGNKNETMAGATIRDVFFYEGMGMNENNFRDFAFHQGHGIGHTWNVEEIRATSATLSFRPRIS